MKLPVLKIGDLVSEIPIIQGGMGVAISMSRMASAVANEGGIGVIAAAIAGVHEPDFATHTSRANIRVLRREIRKARQLTDGILGVNIMVALTDFAEMVKTAVQEGIDVIFAGAGLPLDLPRYRGWQSDTKLVPIVSSARAAKIICQKWLSRFAVLPDAVVVEGPLAGGHIGFKTGQIEDPGYTLERLVAEVVEVLHPFERQNQKTIPVIAAGGIYSGRDIHKFLNIGAAGVQMGTRFVATHECDADDAFKQMYVDASEDDMVIISSPVGLPGRAIRNTFLDQVDQGRRKIFKCPFQCIKTCDVQKSPYCIAMALGNASKGKLKHGFAFAGKNAHRIKEILSVKELIDRLKTEFGLAVSMEAEPLPATG